MSFAENVRAKMPEALVLPDAFAAVFDWAEANGQKGRFTHTDAGEYLSIYPLEVMNEPGASYVIFHAEGPPLAEPIPAEISARYVSIATAAGNGGKMGFWLGDAGVQQVVIFDHGWPYVLTSDPLVALQFLAMGYSEPAALKDPTMTAAAAAAYDDWDEPILPDGFHAFLKERFGVTPPTTAAALGITIPDYDDMSDPMRQWLDKHMPQ